MGAGAMLGTRSRKVLGFRTVLACALSLSLSVAYGMFNPASVTAATTCVGSRSNWFVGYWTVGVNTTGSSAIISTEYPSLCAGASTFSNSWSMITSLNAGAGWAQTGYIRETQHLNGTMSSFSQYLRTTGDTPVTKWFGGPSSNSIHSYQSWLSGTTIVMWIDANHVDTTNFNPVNYWGPQPWSSQFFEETGHCQTDVAGLPSDKVHFTQVKIRQGASFVASPSLTSPKPDCGTKYGQSKINATTLDVRTAVP